MSSSMFSKLRSKLRTQQTRREQSGSKVVCSQTNSALCKLPAELLLVINEALPLSSQICLTMTCKKINIRVGNRSMTTLQGRVKDDEER